MTDDEYKKYCKFWGNNPEFPDEFLDWIDNLFPEFKKVTK